MLDKLRVARSLAPMGKYLHLLIETYDVPDNFCIWDALDDCGIDHNRIEDQYSTMVPVRVTKEEQMKLRLKYPFLWMDTDTTRQGYRC